MKPLLSLVAGQLGQIGAQLGQIAAELIRLNVTGDRILAILEEMGAEGDDDGDPDP